MANPPNINQIINNNIQETLDRLVQRERANLLEGQLKTRPEDTGKVKGTKNEKTSNFKSTKKSKKIKKSKKLKSSRKLKNYIH